ncbi:MAG TPA: MFS transporter [Ktedonobacterales bacterium]|nr:MFS transporter [Ktedonobacterales bacterium]
MSIITLTIRARVAAQAARNWPRRAVDWTLQRQPLRRRRNYLTLWGGKLVSATGSQMTQIAFPLLVLALTHSAAIAGLAGALRMLPYLLFSLPAGALVDRWDRRRVMILCDSGRAIALGSIPLALLLGHLSVLQICLVAVIEGTLFVFFDLAEIAVLPDIVTQEEMPAAAAQYLSLTDGVTTLLGPALGGVLFALGRMVPFLLDAVTYSASVLALWRIQLPKQHAVDETTHPLNWRTLRGDIAAGVAWLWRHRTLRALTTLLATGNCLVAGEALLVIVLAERMRATAPEVGLILGLGGSGTVFGSLLAERVARRLTFAQAFIGGNWLVALIWLLYAVAPTPFALGLVMAALGAVYAVLNVAQFSYRMSLIPSALQGRISSIIRLLVYGSMPLGLAIAGFFIEHAGATTTVVALGAGLVAVALAASLHPQIRRARSSELETDAPADAETDVEVVAPAEA